MKRFFTLFLCLCLSMGIVTMKSLAAPQWPDHVSIQADGGIVMDADTGTILYGKNMDQQYYPASITKILTALIVLEHCGLDEMVSFPMMTSIMWKREAAAPALMRAMCSRSATVSMPCCWPLPTRAPTPWHVM